MDIEGGGLSPEGVRRIKAIERLEDDWQARQEGRVSLQVLPPPNDQDTSYPPLGIFSPNPAANPLLSRVGKFPAGWISSDVPREVYDDLVIEEVDTHDVHPFGDVRGGGRGGGSVGCLTYTDYEQHNNSLNDIQSKLQQQEELYSALIFEDKELTSSIEKLQDMHTNVLQRTYKQLQNELQVLNQTVEGPPKRLPYPYEIEAVHMYKKHIGKYSLITFN